MTTNKTTPEMVKSPMPLERLPLQREQHRDGKVKRASVPVLWLPEMPQCAPSMALG
jgi:hypothetical protein